VRLKAEFANHDQRLFPNQFVNARLHLGDERGIVVPAQAIQRGTRGAFVFVVDAQGVAHTRDVHPGASAQDIVVVSSGLAVGEKLVTSGADRLRDGAHVTVAPSSAPATADKEPR
jgi:multidrug efflux system membrane fusion protein